MFFPPLPWFCHVQQNKLICYPHSKAVFLQFDREDKVLWLHSSLIFWCFSIYLCRKQYRKQCSLSCIHHTKNIIAKPRWLQFCLYFWSTGNQRKPCFLTLASNAWLAFVQCTFWALLCWGTVMYGIFSVKMAT